MSDPIRNLEQLVRYHQDRYYNHEPEISDAEFDALWDRLRELDPDNSLFSVVGPDSSDRFPKREHRIPMNSQDKAADPEAFLKWAAKVRHPFYLAQFKMDGAGIELQYEEGRFRYGVTRGDGKVGDDITANVSRMKGVPQNIATNFTGGIRGEVLMSRSVHREHYADKANCRNAANGVMKRKDGVGSDLLEVLCYDAVHDEDDLYFVDEPAKLEWLAQQGFGVVSHRRCETAEEVVALRDEVAAARPELDYDIDGLVVKGPEIDPDDMKRARPERQIAFKFTLEEAITELREVLWSISGHLYTPIGVTDPVRLAGTTVKRANLVNTRAIAEMGLKIGSMVRITKRGEIIPKIESVVTTPEGAVDIEAPDVCETCGTDLIDEGTRLFCPNMQCPKREHYRIRKWIEVLDIKDFGPVLVQKLFESGRVRTIADLYTLTEDDIVGFDRMGEGIARRALRGLQSVKEISLARFIAGFNIEGIGELIGEKAISAGFDSLEAIRDAEPSDMAARTDGIGETTAAALIEGVRTLYGEMTAVLSCGQITIGRTIASRELSGRSFCFTGALHSMKRSEAEALVQAHGGTARGSVGEGLSFLVTNDPEGNSSKLQKARALGIAIITETQFRAMIPNEPAGAG